MPHANTRRDFAIPARGPAPERQSRESIDSHARCRETYRSILPHGSMARGRLVRGARGHHWYHVTRMDDSTSALARLDAEMVQLRNAGITEAEMMAMEQHVARTREILFGSSPARDVADLDREDFDTDTQEERLEKARARGESTPATLMHEAEANLRQAAVSTEKARVLYLMANDASCGRDAKTPATVRAATGVGLSPLPMGGRTAETSSDSQGSIYSAPVRRGKEAS